jgi:isocitrate dehydrogenase
MSRTDVPDTVTLIPGDGVGPECVAAAVTILDAAGADLTWDEQHAGERVFAQGVASGVPAETIESIHRNRVALKGPLGTPVGYGEKSANVTLRKLFETYANVRPVRELPGVHTPFAGRGIDLVVVRENVEDLYAGIEHMQTPSVAQCLKLISRTGCEKIVRFAFELARAEGRHTVTCATKSNIMKLTEGELKRTFERIASDYPDITAQHMIVDNAAHQLVKRPEQFDVIVTTNMNGDILSDLTSGLVGGLGFAPSANIGSEVAIFEAVHGSAPKYAGTNQINPTAVLLSAVAMLRHLGRFEVAERVEQAILVTLEDGGLTGDVVGYDKGLSTSDYTRRIIANLGRAPTRTSVRAHQPIRLPQYSPAQSTAAVDQRIVGTDIFIQSTAPSAAIGPRLERLTDGSPFHLKMISNRGTKMYPPTGAITDEVDQHRCRFVLTNPRTTVHWQNIIDLQRRIAHHFDICHVERLLTIDGQPGYTRAQGED